jgi:hypothetical protein
MEKLFEFFEAHPVWTVLGVVAINAVLFLAGVLVVLLLIKAIF